MPYPKVSAFGAQRQTSPDARLDRIESQLLLSDQRQERIEKKLDDLIAAAPSNGTPFSKLANVNPKLQWLVLVLAALAGGSQVIEPVKDIAAAVKR